MVSQTSFERKASSRKSPPRTHRLGIENLEDRRVLSADFGSAFAIGPGAGSWDIAKDAAGNTLVLGYLVTGYTVDVDPGLGIENLSHVPGGQNMFVAKYDDAGNFVKVSRMGGYSGANLGPQLTAGSDGAVYVTGSFRDSAIFGSTTLTSLGGEDPFVTKLDSNLNILWARQLTSGTGNDNGNSVAVDATGNSYVIGELHSGSTDTFITKLDLSGNPLWTRQFGSSTSGKSGGWARGYEITVDGVGNVYATGTQSGTVDFDPGAGVAQSSGNGFVLKIAPSGNVVWARSFAKSGSLASITPQGIGVDSAGNVYTTGNFWGAIDFDPGKAKFNLNPGVDQNGTIITAIYVSALNSSGNFLWAKNARGESRTGGLALDSTANLYVTGSFGGTVDFDPGASTYNLTSAGGSDIVVWKLDSSGNLGWAAGMGGAGNDDGRGIVVDGSGNVYTTGYFASASADFDPSPTGTYNLAGPGLFVSKLVQSAPLAMAPTAEPQTNTATDSGVSSPAFLPASTADATNQPTAPRLLLEPTKSSTKSKLADAALEQADDSWLDGAHEDELLSDLIAAR